MLVDKGIQLKRCARHSSAREQIYSLSVSRMGIGWFNNLAALGLCNRLLNRSPGKQSRHLVINQGIRLQRMQLPARAIKQKPSEPLALSKSAYTDLPEMNEQIFVV